LMKILLVPPCLAYVCIAFFKLRILGARTYTRLSAMNKQENRPKPKPHLLQTLLIHRHLDRDMWETLVDDLVRPRLERGVVLAVGVEVRYGTDAVGGALAGLSFFGSRSLSPGPGTKEQRIQKEGTREEISKRLTPSRRSARSAARRRGSRSTGAGRTRGGRSVSRWRRVCVP
jgi:hypothetical protein